MLPIKLAPGIYILAAGGYMVPSNSTLGSHVHHSDSGTPAMAEDM